MTTQKRSRPRRSMMMLAITLVGLMALTSLGAAATGLVEIDLGDRDEREAERGQGGGPPEKQDERPSEKKGSAPSQPREIPAAWPDDSYYDPPGKGAVFLPGEYHSLCVPSEGQRGYDHFIVDAYSLRVYEIIIGEPKLSEFGFVAATCELPWDVPWPAQARDEGGPKGSGCDDGSDPAQPDPSCQEGANADETGHDSDTSSEDTGQVEQTTNEEAGGD